MNKAIILAGGRGTRLSPLTDGIPKPLVPFLGKSLLERIIEKLTQSGIEKIMITTGYRSDMIKNKIGQHYAGAVIEYLEEKTPLGTAGGLVFSRQLLGLSENEPFVVISGDCVCDFDLIKAFAAHERVGADATIITSECDDPLEYGVVMSKSGGLITCLNEKPCWSQVGSCRVNTGVYILSSRVTELVPQNRPFDFSKDLFPLMLEQGMKLYEHNDSGYWCDIGNIESYYKSCIDALNGKITGIHIEKKNFIDADGIKITPPCFIPHDVQIEKGAEIGPNVILSSRCSIGKNCEIVGSILHGGVRVCENSRVEGSVICENAEIGKRSNICGGSIVAKGVKLSECSYVPSNSTITQTAENENTDYGEYFSKRSGVFDLDEGILLGHTNELETRHTDCAHLGYVLAMTVGRNARVGVMHDPSPYSQAYSSALFAGLERGCSHSYDFGSGFEKLAKYESVFFGTECFVFVFTDNAGEKVYARFFNRNGLAPSHDFERRFSHNMQNLTHEKSVCPPITRTPIHDSQIRYLCEITDNMKAYTGNDGICGARFGFSQNGQKETEILMQAFGMLGGECVDEKDAVTMSIPTVSYSPDDGISVSQGNYTLDKYHMTAALLSNEKSSEDKRFVLPYLSPEIYRSTAGADRIVYYPNNSVKRFYLPKQLLRSCFYLCDEILLAARFISLLVGTKKNISEFYFEQPLFAFREKTVRLPEGAAKAVVIKKLSKNCTAEKGCDTFEGIKLSYPNGRVTVVPGKAQLFRIYSESRNTEIATELCDMAEKDILEAAKNK